MTLTEAKEKWGISINTIIKHIELGEISNLRVENNIIILPDIKKPHFISLKKPVFIYREILRAARNNQYVDENILHISKDEFRKYVSELINESYICPINKVINSSTDYIITLKGENCKENRWELTGFLAQKLQIGGIIVNS